MMSKTLAYSASIILAACSSQPKSLSNVKDGNAGAIATAGLLSLQCTNDANLVASVELTMAGSSNTLGATITGGDVELELSEGNMPTFLVVDGTMIETFSETKKYLFTARTLGENPRKLSGTIYVGSVLIPSQTKASFVVNASSGTTTTDTSYDNFICTDATGR